MTRVLATGTFDLLHPGHILYLERSRVLGDELVVVVARDVNVKHKPRPIVSEEQRLRMISSLKIVDMAVLGSREDMFQPIQQLRPDIITLGYDQHFDSSWLKTELEGRGLRPEIVRIEAFDTCELCSSRKIVSRILERHKDI